MPLCINITFSNLVFRLNGVMVHLYITAFRESGLDNTVIECFEMELLVGRVHIVGTFSFIGTN